LTISVARSTSGKHPDGSHRLLYRQESPEPWFEDFGEGKLVGGKAEVKLDPDYGAVIHNDKYCIFLTEVGDSGGPRRRARLAWSRISAAAVECIRGRVESQGRVWNGDLAIVGPDAASTAAARSRLVGENAGAHDL